MRKFKQWSTTRQTLTIAGALLALLIVVGALSGGSSTDTTTPTTDAATSTASAPAAKPKPKDDSAAVNRNTRDYVKAVNACRLSAAVVRVAAAKGETDLVDMADLATTARDTCDNVRSNLAGTDTEHFDDQAVQAWGGVDEVKSGLNALLAYIDNPRPSKIIEARNKLDEGDAAAREGLRGINRRRHVYELRALKVG